MSTWTRQPQEREGTYFFSGKFLVTATVNEELSQAEILAIYRDVKSYVKENEGADYLFVYIDEDERKLFFIDQLNSEMIASGGHPPEHNYCTLLFAHEY